MQLLKPIYGSKPQKGLVKQKKKKKIGEQNMKLTASGKTYKFP